MLLLWASELFPTTKKSIFKKLLLVERSTVKLLRAGQHPHCSDKDQEVWLYSQLCSICMQTTCWPSSQSERTQTQVSQCASRHVFNAGNSLGLHHGGLHLAFGAHCAYTQRLTETHCPWTEVLTSHSASSCLIETLILDLGSHDTLTVWSVLAWK